MGARSGAAIRNRLAAWCVCLVLCHAPLWSRAAAEPEDGSGSETNDSPARLKVTGLGWLENLRMKAVLRQLRPAREAPRVYDANAIDDGAFLLLNHVQRLGYLRAAVTSDLTLDDGERIAVTWHEDDLPLLPRPLAAREVRYIVDPGLRYYYEDLEFRGLTALTREEARRYFVRADGLLRTRALLRFSRSELDEALGALESALASRGYADAKVTASEVDLNHDTGAVRVVIDVDEGPRYRARAVHIVVRDAEDGPVVRESTRTLDRVLSRLTREDLEQEILLRWFREGYPDATAEITVEEASAGETGERVVDLRAAVIRGPRVRLGEIRFTGPGAEDGRDALKRRVHLRGPWINRIDVDEARARLARLGGFRFVNVTYEPSETNPEARDVVFELEPGRTLTIDLLAGFKSYELLYGGVHLVRRNLFGAGHSVDVRLTQSFKSTEGTVIYSIPDAFAEGVTVYALGDVLIRDEVSFRREEFRASLGVRREFEGTGHQLGLRYNYELLRAIDAPVGVPTGGDADQPLVSSLVLDWDLERRDSALIPRRGYHLGTSLEFAVPELGGEARYFRPEFDASGHLPLGRGRFLHAALRYTIVGDFGDEELLPFNKRIFPGGDDSVRGYLRGEASPLNDRGEEIGAESALVWNLELEQLLTPSWSVVGFVDGVAQAADLSDLPWDEVLWSAGAGIRWNTAIGPVRLEYGHNLNPRDHDPSGTIHFSIGFPF